MDVDLSGSNKCQLHRPNDEWYASSDEIIERGVREHPELSVGSNTDGIDVRSVGNSQVLQVSNHDCPMQQSRSIPDVCVGTGPYTKRSRCTLSWW